MKLKLDESGNVVLSDGKPVYVHDDGKEVAFDAAGTVATITRLNGEAKTHREAKEAAETRLKAFEGIDPAAARDAVDKLSQIDAKKLVEAGDMDAAIQAAVKPYAERLSAAEKQNTDLTTALGQETVSNRFAMSKYAAENLTPAGVDLIRTIYAGRLKVEEGRVVGTDPNGGKMFSNARPGELADFDEVIATFVETYPHKDHILKGTVGPGGGANQPNGGGGGKTLKQSAFDALPAKERAAKMDAGFTVIP